MQRIGMVLDNPFTGDNRVINEAVYLQQNGYEVVVLALNYGEHSPIEDYKGVRIQRILIPEKIKNYLFAFYHRLPLWNKFWQRSIVQFVEDFSLDVLHAHDLYMVEACSQVARIKNIPLVADLHENYPAAVQNYKWAQTLSGNAVAAPQQWKKKEGRILALADRIIVLSDFYRDQLCQAYPKLKAENFAVYPNVPNHEEFSGYSIGNNPLPHAESHWLFYFGVIAKRRGVYTAIDAVKQLRERGHDVRLLLAGNVNKAEQETFQQYIERPDVSDFVLHKPWIDISEFPTYAQACIAGLSPIFSGHQHDIGVANKVFQYMLMGLPVIASDSAAQAQVVRENQCGLVFKSKDVTEMVECTERLIQDTEWAKELGENGKKAVAEKYNVKAMGKRLVSLYGSF